MKKRSLLLSLSCAAPDGATALPGGAQRPYAVYGVGDVQERSGSPRWSDVRSTWLVAPFVADHSIDGGEYGDPSILLPDVRSCKRGGRPSRFAGAYADWRSIVTMRTLRCPRTTGGTGP